MGKGIRVQLITVAGPAVGKQMEVQTGYRVRIGRTDQSHYAVPEDQFLSGVQFSLECSGEECILRDSSRNGTFVNEARVRESVLRDGDRIVGGQTTFMVRIGVLQASDLLKNLMGVLWSHEQPLFAIGLVRLMAHVCSAPETWAGTAQMEASLSSSGGMDE